MGVIIDPANDVIKISSLNKGLVGHWRLDKESFNPSTQRFTDLSAYSNHGTGHGTKLGSAAPGFVADRMGQLIRAAPFGGADDCIRIPDSDRLSSTVAMTAMLWVKGGVQGLKWILTHYDTNGDQRSFAIRTEVLSPNNKLEVLVTNNGTTSIGHYKSYKTSIVVFHNIWHLVGFTFDTGTLKLYVDGVEDTNPTKAADDAITTIYDSSADVMLGCYLSSDTPTGLFTGDLSEAWMWDRALTAAEWALAYDSYRI